MSKRFVLRRRKFLLLATGVIGLLVAPCCIAQTQAPAASATTFEVASVRPAECSASSF